MNKYDVAVLISISLLVILVLGVCLSSHNKGSREKVQTTTSATNPPPLQNIFSPNNLAKLEKDGLLFHDMIPSSPPIIVASCTRKSLPKPEEYPKDYSKLTDVSRVISAVASRAEGSGLCQEVSLSRGLDNILWLAGMIPNNKYVFTLRNTQTTKKFIYTANAQGRIFLANQPFPIRAFYLYEYRLSPVCDDKTGGWSPTVSGEQVFGATQGEPVYASVDTMDSGGCTRVHVASDKEILMSNCTACAEKDIDVWMVGTLLAGSKKVRGGILELLDDNNSKLPIPT